MLSLQHVLRQSLQETGNPRGKRMAGPECADPPSPTHATQVNSISSPPDGPTLVLATVDESADLWASNGKKGDSYRTTYQASDAKEGLGCQGLAADLTFFGMDTLCAKTRGSIINGRGRAKFIPSVHSTGRVHDGPRGGSVAHQQRPRHRRLSEAGRWHRSRGRREEGPGAPPGGSAKVAREGRPAGR